MTTRDKLKATLKRFGKAVPEPVAWSLVGFGLLLAVAGGSYLLGVRIKHEMNAGDFFVAFGTLALAGLTGWLAWQTRRDVGLTQAAIDAADMPFVVAGPVVHRHVDGSVATERFQLRGRGDAQLPELVVALTNIGKGPAIVSNLTLVVGGEYALRQLRSQWPIAAGDTEELTVTCDEAWRGWAPSDEEAEVSLNLIYQHANGDSYCTFTTLVLRHEWLERRSFMRAPL